MTIEVRTQRSVVDLIAQRGYDKIHTLEKRRKMFESMKNRICSSEDCNIKLSMYNDTDFCAQHQRGNIPVSNFL